MAIYLSDLPEDPHFKKWNWESNLGLPIWSCSWVGFAVPVDIAIHSGGLLHHRFTLTLHLSFKDGCRAVFSLWHFPLGHPNHPFEWHPDSHGARTFLQALEILQGLGGHPAHSRY